MSALPLPHAVRSGGSHVELLHTPDCPNVPAAREQLRLAFAELGLTPAWLELDVTAADAPARVRGYGSPTILVGGRDVAGEAPRGDATCRVYADSGVRGAPSVAAIVAALRAPAATS